MHESNTQAKVASNDQLGQMPERTAFEAAMTADGYTLDFLILDGGRRYAYIEAEWALRGWEAAVAAERERCAKLCEAEHVGESLDDGKLCDQDFCYNNALRDAAAAIRGA